ncbi:MAG: hypothetical protein ISS72_03585 [Candidatus Brocadiae bacterium]|nr:hypothetical protein [Candidatus Brocadiia bacterium]
MGGGRWNTWTFSQGEESRYGWIGRGKGDLTRIVRVGFRAQTRAGGLTPFNSKGVMAVIKQGDFGIVLPVKEMLEIIPSQPNRDKLDVSITQEPDGRVRVKGNFSKVPFKIIHYPRGSDPKWIDAEPVLMLRRVGAKGR